jgi:predicted naringenin-chalcone synthase
MSLSKNMPILIAEALPSFLSRLLDRAGISLEDGPYFAIHPGGPKIIEQIASLLHLEKDQFHHSQIVLQNYGNMSSATLPHIWSLMYEDHQVKDGAYIVSLAFGPGVTLAGAVFQCKR